MNTFLLFVYRHVKVYDVASYKLVATMDYPVPILSMGVSVGLFIARCPMGNLSAGDYVPPYEKLKEHLALDRTSWFIKSVCNR